MPRLREDHHVRRCVRQRDLLTRSAHRANLRQGRAQLVEHLHRRLDRGHGPRVVDEQAGEQAGAGAHIDDIAGAVAEDPPHRLSRV